MNAAALDFQQEALETEYTGSTEFSDSAADAAAALLDRDPDRGAGNPTLIRCAAVLAQQHSDENLRAFLMWQAEGWERYLRNLAASMRAR